MPEENKEKTQKKRWTLKKVKTRCRTIYWQNFLLTASVVMLTLALLGSAFFALTYSYAIDERSEQMQSKATVVSHMVSSYMENGSLTGLRELADFASNVTDAEFLICNSDGNLLLTTDTTLVNRVLTVPQDVAEGAMSDDTYAVRTTLGEAVARYTENAPRGEFVVVVEGAQQAPVEAITLDAGAALVRAEMEKGLSKKDAVKLVAKQTGLPRNALYEAALQDKD